MPMTVFALGVFQSTPSAWRETPEKLLLGCGQIISIHSLRMEGDMIPTIVCGITSHISIHSLRMEGDFFCVLSVILDALFQSTPSAWRETKSGKIAVKLTKISIHSLRMEGDH